MESVLNEHSTFIDEDDEPEPELIDEDIEEEEPQDPTCDSAGLPLDAGAQTQIDHMYLQHMLENGDDVKDAMRFAGHAFGGKEALQRGDEEDGIAIQSIISKDEEEEEEDEEEEEEEEDEQEEEEEEEDVAGEFDAEFSEEEEPPMRTREEKVSWHDRVAQFHRAGKGADYTEYVHGWTPNGKKKKRKKKKKKKIRQPSSSSDSEDEEKAHTAEDYLKKGSFKPCLLYTSPSPRDKRQSRMPSSA